MGWALGATGAVLLATVVVDLLRGEALAVAPAAFAVLLLPEGLQRVAAARGRARLAGRLATAARAGLVLAGVLVWYAVVDGWRDGRGTDWLLLCAGVVLLVGVALAGAGAVAQRRSDRIGTSARMDA